MYITLKLLIEYFRILNAIYAENLGIAIFTCTKNTKDTTEQLTFAHKIRYPKPSGKHPVS